jgi:drug/metabolite transporter (DMT)-like permease
VTTRRQRPPQILHAIALLWISTSLGVCAAVLGVQRAGGAWDAIAVTVGLMLIIMSVLTVMVWRGRNWARILYVVLVATSLASFLAAWGVAERPAFEVALEAVSYVADAGSFFLMFTEPGSSWFTETREPQA